jgi:hypothetical protein
MAGDWSHEWASNPNTATSCRWRNSMTSSLSLKQEDMESIYSLLLATFAITERKHISRK